MHVRQLLVAGHSIFVGSIRYVSLLLQKYLPLEMGVCRVK